MSDQTRTRQQGGSASQRQPSKAERRAAYKAAAQAAAQARRRRNAIAGAAAGFVAVGLIIAACFIFLGSGGSGGNKNAADSSATPGASTPAGEANSSDASFPPLPAGADPALKTKPEAKAGSGDLTKLTVTPLVEGTGPAVAAGQTITVNYVGVLYKTGQEFDASWKRSQPFSFQVGAGNVIPGWDQGLVGVKVGSRVQLDIPSDLAYGDNPGGGRPGGPLRFIVDVLAAQ